MARILITGSNHPIDIAINNAGSIGPDSPTTDMDWTAMAYTFAANVAGALAVSTACLDHLRRSSRPRTLTVSSQISYMGYAKSDRIAYRASKAAVNKVVQGLATDPSRDGIAAVRVDPCWVRTDMGRTEAELDPKEVATGIISLAERVTLELTGKLFRWTGEERAF
ncbi:SDR family NAD(P)-dependent oxidoreductase [Roseovarius sp. LXJ103]|uniref:SDR family NAD(P)-dependent oxidoreductase n=1 Tax=Roseovarius carneus TaxID=2853164 RepID=UPI000D60F753|nr:SDR family NAD(P)-dependent oxidoreductase [Roseovarius carneus]MBZ8119904.1 SDR family NAD(P)-dependent oxidoreductase [Roseovarius carneus]PWE34504.1 short-chain dehydrogenase [Pelagicola sp. LXJ1103]